MFAMLPAAYSINLPDLATVGSTIATAVTVLWHVLGPIALLVVGVLVIVALVRNKGSVSGTVKTLESEVQTVERVAATPSGKAVVADVEALAAAVAAKLKGDPVPLPAGQSIPADVEKAVKDAIAAAEAAQHAKAAAALAGVAPAPKA